MSKRSKDKSVPSASAKRPATTGDIPVSAPMGTALAVRDIEQASRFYQTLGFKELFAARGADGELAVAILHFGSTTLLLGRMDELHYEHKIWAQKIRRGPHGLGVTLLLVVPNLRKVYAVVKKAGLEILLEPVDEFYGDRVFMFLDADGYEWKISQTIAQVRFDEVAEIVAKS